MNSNQESHLMDHSEDTGQAVEALADIEQEMELMRQRWAQLEQSKKEILSKESAIKASRSESVMVMPPEKDIKKESGELPEKEKLTEHSKSLQNQGAFIESDETGQIAISATTKEMVPAEARFSQEEILQALKIPLSKKEERLLENPRKLARFQRRSNWVGSIACCIISAQLLIFLMTGVYLMDPRHGEDLNSAIVQGVILLVLLSFVMFYMHTRWESTIKRVKTMKAGQETAARQVFLTKHLSHPPRHFAQALKTHEAK